MTELTDAQRQDLSRHGFDEKLLARWRAALRQNRLSKQANEIATPLLAPQPGAIRDLARAGSDEHARLARLGAEAISRGELGVVVLNGGMATRFGGVVKGVVPVLGEQRSFLGLKCEDVKRAQERHRGRIEVFLMNSFATEDATREHFARHGQFGLDPAQVHHFNQFVSVRLTKGGDLFVDDQGELSRYGPGHGDFAPAFRASGCLERLRARGGKHVFVSNVDNLGARVDPVVLGQHIESDAEATVEVAPKHAGDVGGSPYVVDGVLQLVEQIRYPAGFDPDIVDVFNTNTFHFRADALQRDVPLAFYYVEKKVGGQPVVQMERLIGEMTRFLRSGFVRVGRSGRESRFFPVKTPEDLESGRAEIAAIYG